MTPIMCEHGSMLPWQHISRVLLLPRRWLPMSLNRWSIITCVKLYAVKIPNET